MSGGVDSSVSAVLLRQAGYKVVGVFIRVWEPPGYKCPWREDRREAMRVAAQLDIPLLTLDLEKEYKHEVVDQMISEYKRGRTPNPDVLCNRSIKFGAFYDWARQQGADYVATGHYARVKNGKFLTSKDEKKDQTYFLWNLANEQLKSVLFPIGHLTKLAVRQLAKKFKLPNATKPDSQGLCFIGQIDLKDFLGQYLTLKIGKVLSEKGEIIGTHAGAILYTIGERHGFMVKQKSDQEKPYFVIARDIRQNTLTVSHNIKHPMFDIIELVKTNWLNDLPVVGKKYQARIRHRGELLPCLIKVKKTTATVNFLKSPVAPAPGQSVVIYDRQLCLGGGVIQ